MRRAGFTVIFVILGAICGFSQQPVKSDATRICTFSEIYKKDGWTVPGVQGAKVKQHAKLQNISGVFVTVLEPTEADTNIMEIFCSDDHPGRLTVDDIPIRILDLWSLDFSGQIFAYRVSYALQTIDDGKRNELGASSVLFFYDMDGSGRFTVRDSTMIGFLPSFIPDWVKKRAGAAQKSQ